METKNCPSCETIKPTSEFTARGYTCKPCHSAKSSASYQKNKGPQIARANASRIKTREFLKAYKTEHGCQECGETKSWRLAFHHTDPSEKEIEPAKLTTMPQAIREIAKCIVVCHNCHADIHEEWRNRAY